MRHHSSRERITNVKVYSRSWLDNDAIAAWIFLAPALVLLGIFLLADRLPFTSFTAGSFTSAGTYWVGWKLLAFTTQP